MPAASWQGIVYLSPRNASTGLPGPYFDFGNASQCQIELSEDTIERSESRTGSRLPLRKMTKSQGGSGTLKGDEYNRANLALALRSTAVDVAADGTGTTGYVLPTGAVVGSVLALPKKNVTGVAITDSTGSPKTLTLNTNYSLDAFSGQIKLLDLATGGPFVQPFKAAFTGGATSMVGAFTGNPNQEWYLRVVGINTDTNKHGVGDAFRIRIPPAKLWAMINDDFFDWEFAFTVLADLNRQSTDAAGQFFSWVDEA